MTKKTSYEDTIHKLLEDYKNNCEYLVEETIQEYSKIINATKKCNILIIGKTGVGKSTLVNTVFRDKLAEEGVGKPVTERIEKYSQDGCPIAVFDSVGLEISKTETVDIPGSPLSTGDIRRIKREIKELIEEHQTYIDKRIHIIWYCVNSLGSRFEDIEADWVRELNDLNIPIVLIVTNTIDQENTKLIDSIKERRLPIKRIIPILAKAFPVKIAQNNYTISPFGLDNLIKTSADSLVDKTREVFIQQQIVNIELTEKEALKYVIGYSAIAGAVGLVTPIPGADIPVIFQTQAIMTANIINMFGLSPNKDFLKHLLTAISGTVASSMTGNFLKTIPGIGTVTGEMISAITASTMTGAFGTALVKSLKVFRSQQVNVHQLDQEGKEILISTFMQEYQNYLDLKNV